MLVTSRQPRYRVPALDNLGKDTVSYLHIGEVDPIEIAEHLVYLGSVLQHRTGSLSQVVQGRVSP